MSLILNNHINQPKNQRMYQKKVGTKSVHFRYNDSGICKKGINEKSLKTICFEAFLCGVDETRTRDLLRDRKLNPQFQAKF